MAEIHHRQPLLVKVPDGGADLSFLRLILCFQRQITAFFRNMGGNIFGARQKMILCEFSHFIGLNPV